MTDIMFTRTALTEAAEQAGVTTDQARTILEAAGVTVQPEKREPGWYLTEDGEVARVKPNKHTGALMLNIDGDVLLPHQPWPKLTPARVVPVATAPVTLTEDQVGELWGKHRGTGAFSWVAYSTAILEAVTATVNAALAKYSAPAEGEPIDLGDVREGDRVRVVLKDGDAATFTFTVRTVSTYHLCSSENAYSRDNIRSVRLLHREGEA